MTIQQVAGNSSNGIMGFLFQDDGSTEGTVLEGAEFARTLHQLLGEEAAQTDAAPAGETDGKLAVPQNATPLSTKLDTLAGDFTLPMQDPELQAQADGDADEPDAGKALWSIANFADMMGMSHARAAIAAGTDTDHEARISASAQQADASSAANAAATPASTGVEPAIDLALGADQAAVLAQQVPVPPFPSQAMLANGRSAPASGKFLPQGFRPATNALSQAMAGATTRSAQPANATADAVPAGSSEGAFSAAFNSNFISELLGADARSPQGNGNTPTPNVMQGLNNARVDNPLPAAMKAPAESAPMPSFDSPYLAGSDAWFEDLGTRLEWLSEMNIEKAELQLHPAELGQLEIQISNGDDGTSVSFVTHNAEARALIEDSMPKLRELLAHQGLQLGDSQVSQQSGQQRDTQDMSGMPSGTQPDARAEEEAPARRTVYVRDPNRIDHYA
ncbi:MAG: flagellar hook-length control protein FliK [Gammaproteobacteria bacterium]